MNPVLYLEAVQRTPYSHPLVPRPWRHEGLLEAQLSRYTTVEHTRGKDERRGRGEERAGNEVGGDGGERRERIGIREEKGEGE